MTAPKRRDRALPRGRGWDTRGAPGSGRYLKSFQNMDPTLRCRPDFVHGMPVERETLRFAFVIPTARFQLKPPLFIASPLQWPKTARAQRTAKSEQDTRSVTVRWVWATTQRRASVGWRSTLPALRTSE